MIQFNKLSKTPYRSVVWRSVDQKNNPIYHTNVVMAILRDHVVLCTDSIVSQAEKYWVVQQITNAKLNHEGGQRKVIEINYGEMMEMAGNMIMVTTRQGEHCVIMSERARQRLVPHKLKTLTDSYKVISADLRMIETIGGGSARCMVAELF